MNVGKHTYGIKNIKTFSWGENCNLKIGSFCSIGGDIKIFLGGNHRTDWISTFPFGHTSKETFKKFNGIGSVKSNGDVEIGNDVWIGSHTTIMSGVKIGDGAVIAANSHVISNINPYEVFGGNPAKFIKKRFSDENIKKLLEIKWWELEDSIIDEISPFLCSNDLTNFFEKIKSYE